MLDKVGGVAFAIASDVGAIGIFRIGRGIAIFFNAYGMPVMERNFAVHAAAIDARGTGILLAAAQAIRESVVGRHVIHRRRRLRIPIAPRRAAICADDAALIAHDDQDVGIARIDPHLLIIVTARRATDRRPR